MNPEKESLANVSIVDHHRLFAEATAYLLSSLQPGWKVKVYASATEYLKDRDNRADIVLAEIAMRDMSGLDFIKHIRRSSSRLIVLSHLTEPKTIRVSIRNGAQGYLSKNVSSQELIKAITTIIGGGSYVAENLRKQLIASALLEEHINYNLSPREKQVLQHICSGKTIKETSQAMKLSNNTVQTYYRTLLRKLNINRVADLIVLAIQTGLYVPDA